MPQIRLFTQAALRERVYTVLGHATAIGVAFGGPDAYRALAESLETS